MISVVIPTYNEAEVIEETLGRSARALASSGEEFELIVVDDAWLTYQRICAPAAILNAIATLLFAWRGCHLMLAAASGVVAAGMWNLLLNVPSIWRVWSGTPAPQRLYPAKGESTSA